MSIMRSILCLTPSSLAFVLGGAHFWRAGQYPFSVGCMLFALLVWRREAWIRQVTLVLLPLLAARWVWAAAQFVQIRMFMEQPWMRLACILLGVSLFTATAALLLEPDKLAALDVGVRPAGKAGMAAGAWQAGHRPQLPNWCYQLRWL